jgi:outer membrane receptor for ferrienterochelin and colicin
LKHGIFRTIITIIIIFTATQSFAQPTTGTIAGELRDGATQQPLPYANIVIEGTSQGAVTNEAGYFSIKNVAAGTYALRASMLGYKTVVRSDVVVLPRRNTTVHMELASSAIEVEGVSVTADYFQKPKASSVSYKSLLPEEIRRSPGSAEDIFRVMQSLPGVATAGGKSAQLIVRGGSPDENLTLLDNVEIYNPIHFARTGESMGIISIINPSLLKQVDFITGGFPAKYGDKMSSVFEMSMKDGNREMMNSDVNLNLGGFGAMVDAPVFDNGSLVFSARRGFFDLLTSVMNKPAAPRYYDAVGKLTYDLDPKNRLSILGFYYLDQISREGTAQGMSEKPKYDYITRDDYGSAVGLNWRWLLSSNIYMLTTASFTSNGWNTLQGTISTRDLKGDDIRENEYSIKSELNYQVSHGFELMIGGMIKLIDSQHRAWTPQDTTRSGQLIPATSISYNPDMTEKPSVFVQTTFRPIPIVNLSAGVRYDYFAFNKEGHISPRISAALYLTEETSLNAAFGVFYQTPAAYQIALDPLNQELKSSRADHYIVGIEQRLGDDSKATVEVYHKDLTNVIVGSDTSNILTNNGSGYAEGIEFSIQKKLTDGIVGSASYTYSTSQRRDAGVLPLYDFEYDRPHIVNFLMGMELGNEWQIGAKFQYASGSPYTPVASVAKKGSTYYVVDGAVNSARYPDYHKLDLRIDKKFYFEAWNLTVYLDLWNVYNRTNVLAYTYNVDANGTLTTSTRLDFGILPIAGVTAQF